MHDLTNNSVGSLDSLRTVCRSLLMIRVERFASLTRKRSCTYIFRKYQYPEYEDFFGIRAVESKTYTQGQKDEMITVLRLVQ